MPKPICPICHNPIRGLQIFEDLTLFHITCKHCNHELTLSLKWRLLFWLELLAVLLFYYYSSLIRESIRVIAGHPFSTIGGVLALAIVIGFITWNSAQYERLKK